MQSTDNASTDFQFENSLTYRVNIVLALLFALLFFTGSLFSVFNIPTEKLLSEGNVIVLFLVLFASGIYFSWYYQRLSGLLLLILGAVSVIYLFFHLENWMFHLMPIASAIGVGLFFVIHRFSKESKST